MDGSGREVAPGAGQHQPAVAVAHQLSGVVTEHQAVAPGEQLRLQPHRRGSAGSSDQTVQCACWKNPSPAQVQVRKTRPSRDVRRAVRVLHQVRVAQPGHPEQPRADRRQPHVRGHPTRSVCRSSTSSRRRSTSVGHLGPLGQHGLPAVAGVDERGDLVLAERERQPERAGLRHDPAAQHAGAPVASAPRGTAGRSGPTSGPARARRRRWPAPPPPSRPPGTAATSSTTAANGAAGPESWRCRPGVAVRPARRARRSPAPRARPAGTGRRCRESGRRWCAPRGRWTGLGCGSPGPSRASGSPQAPSRVAPAPPEQQGAPRRPRPGVRAVRHPFRPERETPSMTNRCANR